MSMFKDNMIENEKVKRDIIEKYEEEHEQQIVQRYKEDMENNEKMIKPFSEIMREIIGTDTYIEFQNKTELGYDLFYKVKGSVDAKTQCAKNTIVSVCVGYNVGLKIAEELLRSQGSSFNPHNKTDSAYIMLLTEYRGKTVSECNELLEKLGIRKSYRLGVCARRPRKTKK